MMKSGAVPNNHRAIVLPALPGTGVGHAGPGFGRRQRAAGLQQFDGDAVRRADEPMRPSRGGRLIVTPRAMKALQVS
jgi:hypothetical protein